MSEYSQVLAAVCDTYFPSLEPPEGSDQPEFWRRAASDLGVPLAVENLLETAVPEPGRTGLKGLLAFLAAGEFAAQAQEAREGILAAVAGSSPDAAAGIGFFRQATLFCAYGLPGDGGHNPNWAVLQYPGPIAPPPALDKPLKPLVPEGHELTLEADTVIVGSGAGGGVIAAVLAGSGRDVVVMEAGGYFNEADFNQLELWAYQNLYWRGGPTATADGNLTLLAGACLGGGTTVNWMNCVPTTPWVRQEWARGHGLKGLDGPEYDQHLGAVLERIKANDECSEFNGPHQRMSEGAGKLGWSFKRIVRNADPEHHEYRSAGYVGFGDQSGSKQGTLKTFLQDAADQGARMVARCRVERVLVEDGRAAGVEGTWTDGSRTARVTVRAGTVVIAAGALESPALLLRSGIGGPFVGQGLRLHPVSAVGGIYEQPQEAYFGAPQSALVDQFGNLEDGYGFLIESTQYAPGLLGSATPWRSGSQHKAQVAKSAFGATFIAVCRDHGSGRVTLDSEGEGVTSYSLDDELDRRVFAQGIEACIRLHEAAGAIEIGLIESSGTTWRRGEDLEEFIGAVRGMPAGAGAVTMFSAHQMGTCRMGLDPATSVAGPWGELHDVRGVWIGDGSAFPSAAGTNPMVTIMALARRTAFAILRDSKPDQGAGT